MKGSIRVSAKTLDDAITEALIQLGVTSDRLEYEVIEKGEEPEVTVEDIIKEEFRTEKKPEAPKKNEKPAKVKEEAKAEPVAEVKKETAAEAAAAKEEPEEAAPVKKEVELAKVEDQTIEAVSQFINDTLKAMNMEVKTSASIDEDGALCIDMEGEHMGILIGKRGQTLDALQYLANRVANKHQDGYVRVKLDTENYRARREETLKHLAKNIAHKVKRNRRPVALEPMNPYERRIIHSALQSDPYVTTHSEGEEPYRKVVVTLKR